MKRTVLYFLKEKISFKRYPIAYISFFLVFFLLILLFFNRFLFASKILLLSIIILVSVILGKSKILLKDWFVFLSFIYLFDSLRGTIYILTCKFNLPVYTLYVIKMEEFLFGSVPSVVLQKALLKTSSYAEFGWLEKFLTVMHGTHFIAFLFVGLIVWLHKSNAFRAFKSSFYLATFLGVSGYFLLPTVPPWMASGLFGLLPEIMHFNLILYNMSIPDITSGFNTNPVAAMPSLHATFPILCSFILWRLFRWKATPFYVYTLIMLFTIVYTGDHYVVDLIAGLILAIFCYSFAFRKKAFFREPSSKNRTNKSLILGGIILFMGISIGLGNKNQFDNHYDFYNYFYVPNYIDFLKNKQLYAQNYYVQMYFGSHTLFKKDYEKALFFFENAKSQSKNIIEKKQAEMKIRQCQLLLKKEK